MTKKNTIHLYLALLLAFCPVCLSVEAAGRAPALFNDGERVCFIGHSHIPGVYTQELRYIDPKTIGNEYRLEDGRKALINTGAVGQPRDGDPRASYVTFNGSTVKFHRLDYDFKKTMEKIYKEDRLPNYLADRLAVGR